MVNKKKHILDDPFVHRGLEYKQNLVVWANELRNGKQPQDLLASALIYSSVCEYAAKHLLESLKLLFYRSTYRDFAALIYIDLRSTSEKRTLNQSADELLSYGFPDKSEIIKLMKAVARTRNNVMHQLAETEPENLASIDADIQELIVNSNELINKIDIVYAGLGKVLAPAQEVVTKSEGNKA